ncbi:MAG: CDP-alcohol phosphatidyltransferase family protein [Treponema sp.]|jgi:phosphatidylglycerophosphate synthase|nr:CDP-alcohol phosphatidyltransferase family protein [Treponema sp.]
MDASANAPLQKSIRIVLGAYSLTEGAVFFFIARMFSFPLKFFFVFLGVQTAFHLGIFFFLTHNAPLFYNTKTKKRFSRINMANKVTLLRLTMLPFLLFLILAFQHYPVGFILLPVIGLTFFTDLIDGRLSRAKNEETPIGKILDSVSDYLLLGGIGIVYWIFRLLPPWLFAVLLARLFIQSLLMMILFLIQKRPEPQSTFFGKITVAAAMILFVAEPAAIVLAFLPPYIRNLEIILGALIGISLVDKGIFFIAALKKRKPPEKNRG